MINDDLWLRCLNRLKAELSPQEMNMWIHPLHPTAHGDGLVLLAPNTFVLQAVRDRHMLLIEQILAHLTGAPVQVALKVGSVGAEQPPEAAVEPSAADQRTASNLDAHYRFESFVRGKSNELAHAAALQVADNPGHSSYNPLLLYGGTGLGKTHLLHAVGNRLTRQGNKRVMYLHSEQFVSGMVQALRHNTIDQFKQRYRTADALLIDDIQFFAGKERSQEEFFHTFNTLLEGKQQIILTCDRYPKEVNGLEARLKSRFGWGLSVAVEPPDFETRVAILISKASDLGRELSDEVAFFIAKRIQSNVRELEGALNTLSAHASFSRREITLQLAKEALRDLMTVHERQITIENIQKTVVEYFKIRIADLHSKRRTRMLARPRQIAMSLAKELTEHSLPEIGDAFGGRDHTTVLHAYRKIGELRKTDGKLREDYEKLLRLLTT